MEGAVVWEKGRKGQNANISVWSKYLSKCQTKCFLAQRRTAEPCITVQKSIFSKESGKLLQRFIGICAKNMKMWYVRLVFVFIFYINSNEHENQYLLWHGHLLFFSLAWTLLAKVCFVISLSSLQEEFSRFLDIQSSSLDVGGLFSVLCQHDPTLLQYYWRCVGSVHDW